MFRRQILRARFQSTSSLAPLKFKGISVKDNKSPKVIPANKDLVFGHTFSDHMLIAEWDAKSGWSNPVISPYGNLSLDPSSTVFHYGTECN